MGRRGPPKKPAALHERQGTFRADRHSGGIVEGRMPPKPAGLSKAAEKEWDRLAPHLAEAGLLHDRFQMAFAAYCECVAEYWAHKATVSREGYITETSNGNLIQHPAVGMMGKCLDRMVKLERELGLTPASATGLQPGSEGWDRDPLDVLQKGRTQSKSPRGSKTS